MRTTSTFLLATVLLAACSEATKQGTSTQSMVIADQFCAKSYQPWSALVEKCVAEKTHSAAGASCAVLTEVNTILDRRKRESNFKDCGMEIRFGPNAKNR